MSRIRVMLGFDMETDVGSWTPWYEGMVHGTPRILSALAKRGIQATFYFTGAGARKHSEVVHAVRDAGHEIGCHTLFHETIGEPLFEIPGMTPILPEEVFLRLKLATEWVAEVAGVRPVSFRCPRLFGSTAVVNALEKLGYKTDATYPMYYFRDRLEPYHPAAEDWTKPGSLSLLELPNFADLSMKSKDPFGRDMDQWPLFRTESADALLGHIDGFIRYCAGKSVDPFLCFYFHPWEFWPMPEGLIRYGEGAVQPEPFIVRNCGDYALEQLERLLDRLGARNATFQTALQVAG